jgi:hypothetical protein
MTTSSENAITVTTSSAGALTKIDLPATRWFRDQRKISVETLAKLDVATGTAFYPELNEKRASIFFKYSQGWKARTYPDKYFVAGGSLHREFWNLARVLKAKSEIVYITEGETDALALVEAGISADQVISAHGANDSRANGTHGKEIQMPAAQNASFRPNSIPCDMADIGPRDSDVAKRPVVEGP